MRQVSVNKKCADIGLSWTMLKDFLYKLDHQPVSEEALKVGKERHEKIQSTHRLGYCEVTPFVILKIQGKKVLLVGHVDAVDFQHLILTEIKSRKFYENNRDLVLLQIAYYYYLISIQLRRYVKKEEIKIRLLLYYKDTVTEEIMGYNDIKGYISLIKRLIRLYVKQVSRL